MIVYGGTPRRDGRAARRPPRPRRGGGGRRPGRPSWRSGWHAAAPTAPGAAVSAFFRDCYPGPLLGFFALAAQPLAGALSEEARCRAGTPVYCGAASQTRQSVRPRNFFVNVFFS